jgi:hypothetical protein
MPFGSDLGAISFDITIADPKARIQKFIEIYQKQDGYKVCHVSDRSEAARDCPDPPFG